MQKQMNNQIQQYSTTSYLRILNPWKEIRNIQWIILEDRTITMVGCASTVVNFILSICFAKIEGHVNILSPMKGDRK
ncbi:hypothetical protein MKW98_011692 [Papaver atlanticum]|uniref:Uncharacterized protein n=1 Tax=Papaver atlanticum TaxID=357466 RepID=A0AAD4S7T4_9MAGN|nr:hypothetical protein MKW98_011692 [Papaver atlanticum]